MKFTIKHDACYFGLPYLRSAVVVGGGAQNSLSHFTRFCCFIFVKCFVYLIYFCFYISLLMLCFNIPKS